MSLAKLATSLSPLSRRRRETGGTEPLASALSAGFMNSAFFLEPRKRTLSLVRTKSVSASS